MKQTPRQRISVVGVFLLSAMAASCTGIVSDPAANDSEGNGNVDTGVSALCLAPPARIWPLTPAQYENAVRELFADAPPAVDRLAGLLRLEERRFHNEAGHSDLSDSFVAELYAHTEATAAQVAANPSAIAPCLAEVGAGDEACLTAAVRDLLERAWRRPVEDSEVGRFVTYVQGNLDDESAALATVVQGVLLSPSFIYRTELGPEGASDDTVELEAYEKAAALSFFLMDSPPDDELLAAARAGELDDAEGLEAHARRILGAPSQAVGLLRFFSEYSGAYLAEKTGKDTAIYPAFNDALAADMSAEIGRFVAHVLAEDDARFETLFTAPYSVVSPRLAELYGVDVEGEGWQRVDLPRDERAGLLTMAGVLTPHGRPHRGDPVFRGLHIREHILCGTVAAPPDEIEPLPNDEPGDPVDGTMRERLAEHLEPNCRGCHELIDPLGLPLERYDGIGRFRTHDGDHLIDPSGELLGVSAPVAFHDAIGMAHAIARHPVAEDCFVRSLFHYAYGRAPSEADSCEIERVRTRFAETQGNIIETVIAIVTSSHFVTRRNEP